MCNNQTILGNLWRWLELHFCCGLSGCLWRREWGRSQDIVSAKFYSFMSIVRFRWFPWLMKERLALFFNVLYNCFKNAEESLSLTSSWSDLYASLWILTLLPQPFQRLQACSDNRKITGAGCGNFDWREEIWDWRGSCLIFAVLRKYPVWCDCDWPAIGTEGVLLLCCLRIAET